MPNPVQLRRVIYPAGRRVGVGVSANSAAVQGYLDRCFSPPEPGSPEEIRIAGFIDGLVADGVWARLDALNLWFAGANEGDCHVNLIQAAYNTERYQISGAAIYTQGQGYSGGGAIRCIASNFNPYLEQATAKFQRNDASFGIWIYSTATVAQPAVDSGARISYGMTALDQITLYPKWNTTVGYHGCNAAASETFPAADGVADSSGFYIVQRTGANAAAVYRNDMVTPVDTSTAASIALSNSEIWYRCESSCRMAFIGGALTEAQRQALKDRLTTLITAISGVIP